jgi:hypothetical protein
MVFYSFHLAIFTIIFFVLGMIKPKWPLFFLKEPTRFMVLMITPILIMITVTLYGEGLKREQEEKALQETPAKVAKPAPVPVPVPSTEPSAGAPAAKK